MSAPALPRTVTIALRSPLFAALASASAASSALLKDCWAPASDVIAASAAVVKMASRSRLRCERVKRDIMAVSSSVRQQRAGRHACAGGKPLPVGLERHADPVVENPEIASASAHHCFGHHRLHLLRHHTHIGAVAAVVGEAIEAEAVVEVAQQGDVVLETDVGPTSAAAAAAATAAATPPKA